MLVHSTNTQSLIILPYCYSGQEKMSTAVEFKYMLIKSEAQQERICPICAEQGQPLHTSSWENLMVYRGWWQNFPLTDLKMSVM